MRGKAVNREISDNRYNVSMTGRGESKLAGTSNAQFPERVNVWIIETISMFQCHTGLAVHMATVGAPSAEHTRESRNHNTPYVVAKYSN